MASDHTGAGKQSTFGRNLMNYVASKMPYSNFEAIDATNELNPKFKYFENQGTRRAEALAKHSVSQSNEYNEEGIGAIGADSKFGEMMYANVQKNKGARINDYRVMAAFAEVSDALDEICDEIINKDENGDIVKIDIHARLEEELSMETKTSLVDEFRKYVGHYELEKRGWGYFRDILVEGELYLEHIIHASHTDKGVLGVMKIPTDLIDPIYNNIQNLLVKGFLYRKPIIEPDKPAKVDNFDYIPMEQNQVVYFDSGIWNENHTVKLPFIENARRAYRQLSLVEDAILIYRLVRAPERLVFNVDVGNMAPPKAETYLRKLMAQYWSTKTFDANQNDIVNKFNPQSMLDAFWFAKRAGSEGTSVTQLPGGANLGELADLMYFVKKLYKSLKVPTNRLSDESFISDNQTAMLREELKFAKFIVRMQQHFASSLKQGFITHLKMTEIWQTLEIKEADIEIAFNPPSNYYELREAQKLGMKLENFNNLTSNESISNTFCQKRYLGWDDTAILANRAYLRTDKAFAWELAQIEAMGPEWRKAVAAQADGLEGAAPVGADMGGGGDMGAASGMPPSFGGGPADPNLAPEGEDVSADPASAAAETPV